MNARLIKKAVFGGGEKVGNHWFKAVSGLAPFYISDLIKPIKITLC